MTNENDQTKPRIAVSEGSDNSVRKQAEEVVCTENLNPDVVVMKSAKDRV